MLGVLYTATERDRAGSLDGNLSTPYIWIGQITLWRYYHSSVTAEGTQMTARMTLLDSFERILSDC